ncbi:MAG: histidine kinase, partial [Spirochaetales bacterium]|nr:histidine kinase [Spirochaetales bacterium]
KKGYVFIVNKKGDIVFHPRQDLIYNNLKHENIDKIPDQSGGSFIADVDDYRVLYTYSRAELTGWISVGISYTSELFLSRSKLQFYLWGVILVSFIFIVILSSVLSARITKPIEELRSSMKQVEQGNFDIDITVECAHEVHNLAEDCNIAIKKIRELITQIQKEQELKRKNEFKALQAQVNPHFLYNTLDSIIWLTESGKNDDAVIMTESLARFFRLSLSKGDEIITIRQMIDHISCYLSIQKMRYKYTLDYTIMVNPEIYKYYTLKLLLQPLVENSIYHGLKNQKGIGHIIVSGDIEGGIIKFIVRDDGIGMRPDLLKKVRVGDFSEFTGSGVGLRSVAERIKLFFGYEYGIDFPEQPEKGTRIIIRLPIMEEP